MVVGGMKPADPTGYGRLIVEDGRLIAIREERDATPAERAIRFCNGGVMGISGAMALEILDEIGDENDQHEFYLTDAVEVADRLRLKAVAVEIPADDVFGINDRVQLADAERKFQERRRAAANLEGVTLVAPGDGVLLARYQRSAATS